VLLLPAAFAAIALALLVASALGHLATLPSLLAVATVVAVMARAALTFRENVALLGAREQARTDELTGLLNRRGFYAQAAEQLEDRADGAPSMAVVLLDLDRFWSAAGWRPRRCSSRSPRTRSCSTPRARWTRSRASASSASPSRWTTSAPATPRSPSSSGSP
jgi:hypothetical protein